MSDHHDPENLFGTPEEAALSGWSANAQPRVTDVRMLSETEAYVFVDTEPSHPMRVRCERRERGWVWTSDVTA